MSIDHRILAIDNDGGIPCIDPVALGRLMDRVCEGRAPTLRDKVTKALAELRRRLAK